MDSPNTILAPSRFQRLHDAILDLNPVAYYPLNELNGSLALDHANHKFVASAVTSITRSGTTATVTTTAAHGYDTGDLIYISGAVETDYNGSYVIAVTAGTTFTYTVGGTPATPATGTITASKNIKLHGTITGATVGQSGKIGKAYSFDGTGDVINVGNNSLLNSSDFTFICLFNLTNLHQTGGTRQELVKRDTPYIFDLSTDGKLEFAIHASGAYGNVKSVKASWAANTWFMIALSNTTGANNSIIYINGVSNNNRTGVTPTTSTATMFIGAQDANGTASLNGKLQHVVWFNRALTAEEVLKLARIAELT